MVLLLKNKISIIIYNIFFIIFSLFSFTIIYLIIGELFHHNFYFIFQVIITILVILLFFILSKFLSQKFWWTILFFFVFEIITIYLIISTIWFLKLNQVLIDNNFRNNKDLIITENISWILLIVVVFCFSVLFFMLLFRFLKSKN